MYLSPVDNTNVKATFENICINGNHLLEHLKWVTTNQIRKPWHQMLVKNYFSSETFLNIIITLSHFCVWLRNLLTLKIAAEVLSHTLLTGPFSLFEERASSIFLSISSIVICIFSFALWSSLTLWKTKRKLELSTKSYTYNTKASKLEILAINFLISFTCFKPQPFFWLSLSA